MFGGHVAWPATVSLTASIRWAVTVTRITHSEYSVGSHLDPLHSQRVFGGQSPSPALLTASIREAVARVCLIYSAHSFGNRHGFPHSQSSRNAVTLACLAHSEYCRPLPDAARFPSKVLAVTRRRSLILSLFFCTLGAMDIHRRSDQVLLSTIS